MAFKPDLEEADRRFQAFYAGDLVDRPLVAVAAPREGLKPVPGRNYQQKVFGDLDDIIAAASRRGFGIWA